MIRKGAISANKDEAVIIPINMRDGILLGTGLGNAEWNCSAPHGAGRTMKRDDVKEHFTVSSFKREMKGIYSSCINSDTLDEAPFAYRGIDEMKDAIRDTVTIDKIIKPIYNFKAGGK
jgi:RNA-splicing ligase RtcB